MDRSRWRLGRQVGFPVRCHADTHSGHSVRAPHPHPGSVPHLQVLTVSECQGKVASPPTLHCGVRNGHNPKGGGGWAFHPEPLLLARGLRVRAQSGPPCARDVPCPRPLTALCLRLCSSCTGTMSTSPTAMRSRRTSGWAPTPCANGVCTKLLTLSTP